MLEFAKGVLKFGHWSNRPVVGRQIMFINCFITATKSGNRLTMGAIFESKHHQVVQVLFVFVSMTHQSSCDGNFIG